MGPLMKHIYNILLILVVLFILSCSRDWNNPFETDSDLSHPPAISNIELNGNHLELSLDYSYSDECTVLFERKRTTAFEPVTLLKLSASVFADTTLDMEQNYNLVYRLRVQKNGYTSDYSNEKQFSYVSSILNAPSELTCSSIELQGVRLNWTDNSSKETGFRIEKNVNGSGFSEVANLPANTTTFLDAISGMPDPPQSIIYRIRAYNNNLNSAWTEQNVIYSGLGAPTNLHITNSHFWEFTIAWTRNSTIATGYQIERKKDNGAYIILATVGAAVQTYTTELYENGSYSFRVKAVRNGDSSTYSNELIQQIDIVMPTSGLIAYYPFNGNANDESGNGHNGSVHGATLAVDRFGVSQNSYAFNGTADIQCNLNVPETDYTISLWYNTNSPYGGLYSVLTNTDIEANDRNIFLYDGLIKHRIWHNDTTTEVIAYDANDHVNDWNNVVVVVEEGVGQKMYLNSELVCSGSFDHSGFNWQDKIDLGFSRLYHNNIEYNSYFTGSIDEIRIYSRILSPPEIKSLFHEGGWTGTAKKD